MAQQNPPNFAKLWTRSSTPKSWSRNTKLRGNLFKISEPHFSEKYNFSEKFGTDFVIRLSLPWHARTESLENFLSESIDLLGQSRSSDPAVASDGLQKHTKPRLRLRLAARLMVVSAFGYTSLPFSRLWFVRMSGNSSTHKEAFDEY